MKPTSLPIAIAVLLLLAIPAASNAQFCLQTNNGALAISCYSGPGGTVVIPSETNGMPVTSIADSAFAWRYNITNLTIPDSVTNIASSAFAWCQGLANVSIGSNLVTIADSGVFFNCFNLSAITVHPNNPAYSSLDGVLFDKTRTTLLQYPTSRTGTYSIPDGVAYIAWNSFRFAVNLTGITMPDSVHTIDFAAFQGCVGLTTLSIGNGVVSIWGWAFEGCTNITTLDLGDSLQTISNGAFLNCSALPVVTIPSSVTSIGSGAFAGCTSLSSFIVSAGNPCYASLDGMLLNTNLTTLIQCPAGRAGNLVIPSTVSTIQDAALQSCTRLTSVTIPDSVTSIGLNSFQSCNSLTNITIGLGVTTIGAYAFQNCSRLSNVAIPSSVIYIGQSAFDICTSLTAINVSVLNPAYTSLDGVLFTQDQTRLVQCPAGKTGGYALPSTTTSIGDFAFDYCSGLTSVAIPNTVTNIGTWAFAYCTNLTTLALPTAITRIPSFAFYRCYNLRSVDIPDTVTDLGSHAFFCCSSLTGVSLPAGIPNIGAYAFWNCGSLTEVSIPNSVTNIDTWAFNTCQGLASATIGSGVRTIGAAAFDFLRYPSPTGIYFKGHAPLADPSAFGGANKAKIYYLPGTIGWGATLAGCPTFPWLLPYPVILTFGPRFGVQTNQFGFIVSWASNAPVVVEACANLANPIWSSLSTNTLPDGWFCFSDSDWTNHPTRVYRIRSP